MQLILTQDVANLGTAGELVAVKPGYGRNYLLPQGLAVTATTRNRAKLNHDKGVIERRIEKEKADAGSLGERINRMTLQFERLVGEDDKMFGSVTARDIGAQLETAGLKLDHRKLQLDEPIRALGKYEVPVKLGANVIATLKFWVVGKAQE